MRRIHLLGALTALILPLTAAENPAVLEKEKQPVGGVDVSVSSKKDLTITFRDKDPDVKVRELWYAEFDSNAWGPWQKHGIAFDRDTPIVWAPPEGHWQVFVRVTQVSGLAAPVPTQTTKGMTQFIIDRTAPTVAITAPLEGAKLRAGSPVTIAWKASDLHLHSVPITISWQRDTKSEPTVLAANIKNSGTLEWLTPRDMTNTGTITVTAADKALNTGSAQVKNLTIDAIAPSGRIVGPEISDTLDIDIELTVLDAGPAGIQQIKLWYSQDNGQTWAEGPKADQPPFTSLAWKAPGNGTFLLNLWAEDQAGNATAVPKQADDAGATIIVDTEAPKVVLANQIGLREVDAQGGAVVRSVFKPGDKVIVPVRITDANLTAAAASYFLQVQTDAPWQSLGKDQDPEVPFTFELPNLGSDACRVKVVVVDKAGNIGEAVSTESFRIDNEVKSGDIGVNLDL
jgi:hypothetical protein